MFNPIVTPVRNNLHLTKKAVATFKAQDIDGGAHIFIVNNQSTDGTNEFMNTERDLVHMYFEPPLSVAQSWNTALKHVFKLGAEYALVVNNDVELRVDTYRRLVEDGGGLVTAVGQRELDELSWYAPPNPERKRNHPDFSCFLIRRSVYEQIGDFDENFLIAFCEDGDYDIRLYRAGIRAYCLDLPFLHHGSMTIKNADRAEIRRIQIQADKNREYFKKKWGFAMASEEYYQALGKGGPEESAG